MDLDAYILQSPRYLAFPFTISLLPNLNAALWELFTHFVVFILIF